jgi:SAM-dependent methyltransferase
LISFLDLHWQNDPLSALGQAYERLAPEGLFMGVFWGGDTLHELRRVMVEVESQLTGGAGMRISPMITPYDTAALMQKAGFALPVVDMQSITLTYTHVQSLVEDLRTMGETAAFAAPANKPLTRIFWQEVETHYHRLYGLENGKIPATFTPIYMLGWRG